VALGVRGFPGLALGDLGALERSQFQPLSQLNTNQRLDARRGRRGGWAVARASILVGAYVGSSMGGAESLGPADTLSDMPMFYFRYALGWLPQRTVKVRPRSLGAPGRCRAAVPPPAELECPG